MMTYVPTGQTGPLDWRISGRSCVPTDNVSREVFKALQRAIRSRGKSIAVDGIIGPNTLSAIQSLGFTYYKHCQTVAANARTLAKSLGATIPFFGKVPTPSVTRTSTDVQVSIGPATILPAKAAAAIPGAAPMPGKPINWPLVAAVGGGGLLLLMMATQKKKPKRRARAAA